MHRIMIFIVRKFLEKAQVWVNQTPGAVSISMNIGEGDVILATKKKGEKNGKVKGK